MTAAFFHGHDWRAGLESMVECEGGRQVGAILRVDGSWASLHRRVKQESYHEVNSQSEGIE